MQELRVQSKGLTYIQEKPLSANGHSAVTIYKFRALS